MTGIKRFVFVVLAGVASSAFVGCPRPQPPPPPPETGDRAASRSDLLAAAATCILDEAERFEATAVALDDAVKAWGAQPDDTTRAAARAAFHEAMDVWQGLEVMQVGPLARGTAPGAGNLRDHIYSWPLTSRCAVEEQLVARGYTRTDFSAQVPTWRGLDALEYLLFYEGEDTACTQTSTIVADGTWAALEPGERAARKVAYAQVVTADVRARAQEVVTAYSPSGGDFVGALSSAGNGSTVFSSSQMALNALSDAVFYVEAEVKDMKLSPPLGMRDCFTDTCPELLESKFAARSKANLRANVDGARRLLLGCGEDGAGIGFDDVLDAYGAGELAAKLRARPEAIGAALDALGEKDLAQALAEDKAQVRAVHDAVKGLTDLLKTELVTVLDLELPQTIEGDND